MLLSSLAAIVALSRTGSTLFWRASGSERRRARHESGERDREHERDKDSERGQRRVGAMRTIGLVLLLGASPLLVIFAGPLTSFTAAAANQLADQQAYIQSILKREPPDKGSGGES